MPSDKLLGRFAGFLMLICLVLAAFAVVHSKGAPGANSADWQTADWTRNLTVVTAAGLLTQLFFIWRADRNATTAALAARDTAKATLDANRPWLDFDVKLAGPLQLVSQHRAEIRCEFAIENVGNSPAVWTSIAAFVDHLAQGNDYGLVGIRGASVFQGKEIVRDQMASLFDLTTTGLGGESHLVLRVRLEYPLPGTTALGVTVKNWQILGPMLGGVNLRRLPINGKEHLHLQAMQESDTAS